MSHLAACVQPQVPDEMHGIEMELNSSADTLWAIVLGIFSKVLLLFEVLAVVLCSFTILHRTQQANRSRIRQWCQSIWLFPAFPIIPIPLWLFAFRLPLPLYTPNVGSLSTSASEILKSKNPTLFTSRQIGLRWTEWKREGEFVRTQL